MAKNHATRVTSGSSAFMLRIFTVVDWYLPGFKAGGPIQAIANMVAAVADDNLQFCILTRDRDLAETAPYPGVGHECWVTQGNAQVLYTHDHSLRNFVHRIREKQPDIIYLNSFFSSFSVKVLVLRRLGLFPGTSLILAPRGELSPGALSIKKFKKALYFRVAAAMGLYRNVQWHATAILEKEEIALVLSKYRLDHARGDNTDHIHVASDIPGIYEHGDRRLLRKVPGEILFLFVSRISPKKNLAGAIELLSALRGRIRLDICGPVDDAAYWESCRRLIARAPSNLRISYMGSLPHAQLQGKFADYHFMLLPTLGENFGYVIVESLAAGCPVLISDRTSWSDLQNKGIGWDLPLENPESWNRALQQCVDMGDSEYQEMSLNSVRFFRRWVSSSEILGQTRRLFVSCLQDSPDRNTS